MKGLITRMIKYKNYNKTIFTIIYFSIPIVAYLLSIVLKDYSLIISKIFLVLSIFIYVLNAYFSFKNTYGSYKQGSIEIMNQYKENGNKLGDYDFKNKKEEINLYILNTFNSIIFYFFIGLLVLIYSLTLGIEPYFLLFLIYGYLSFIFVLSINEWFNKEVNDINEIKE